MIAFCTFKEVQSHSTQMYFSLYLLSLCSKRAGPWTVLPVHVPVSTGQGQVDSHSIRAVWVTAPRKILAVKGRSNTAATLCCSVPNSWGMKAKPLPTATLSLPPQKNRSRTPHRVPQDTAPEFSQKTAPTAKRGTDVLWKDLSLTYIKRQLPYC